MLLLVALVAFTPFVTSLTPFRHLEGAVTRPAFSIRQTFISTPPQQLSGRAVLSILKRQDSCGSGFCNVQDTCCGNRGCCPGGASCCSNGSCCEAGTLCTQDSQGLVGCCPIGQTCSGIAAGNGEGTNRPEPLSTQASISPTPSTSPSPTPSNGLSVDVNDQTNDKEISTSASQSEPKENSLPASSPATAEVGAGTILGAVVGGILGWIALCGVLVWIHKKRKRKNAASTQRTGPSTLSDPRGPPGDLQGAGSEFVGLKMEISVDPRAPRPYTTLLERDALKTKMEAFAGPLPGRV